MNRTAKCFVPMGTGDSCTLNEQLSGPPVWTDIEDDGYAV